MAKQKNIKGSEMSGLEGFQAKWERRETILTRIKEITTEESATLSLIFEKKKENERARSELDKFLMNLGKSFSNPGGFDEKALACDQQESLEGYRSQLISIEESISETEAVMEKLGNEKNLLQKEVTDFSYGLMESDVLEYQQKVAKALKEIKDIADIIQGQEALMAEANSTPSQINSLKEKKEDILAEIASGQDLKKELEEVSYDIDIEMERIAARKLTITETEKALSGLNRKLASAKEALKKVEGLKNEVLIQYLRFEAERVGKEYGDLSLSLVDKYHALVAIDVFLSQYGGQTIRAAMNFDFSIPAFRVNALESLIVPNWPGVIAKARLAFTADNIKAAVARERDRIALLGIEL